VRTKLPLQEAQMVFCNEARILVQGKDA